MSERLGWIGVDFDGTLAFYSNWADQGQTPGPPLQPMVDRVKNWLLEGRSVRIVTARASEPEQVKIVQRWCHEHIGMVLPVTNAKDYHMEQLWDDLAVQVVRNVGDPAYGVDLTVGRSARDRAIAG